MKMLQPNEKVKLVSKAETIAGSFPKLQLPPQIDRNIESSTCAANLCLGFLRPYGKASLAAVGLHIARPCGHKTRCLGDQKFQERMLWNIAHCTRHEIMRVRRSKGPRASGNAELKCPEVPEARGTGLPDAKASQSTSGQPGQLLLHNAAARKILLASWHCVSLCKQLVGPSQGCVHTDPCGLRQG